MNKNLFTRARLEAHELALALHAFKNAKSLTFLQLCDELNIEREQEGRIRNVASRRPASRLFRDEIAFSLGSLNYENSLILAHAIKSNSIDLYSHIYLPSAPLSNVMGDWSSEHEMQAHFNEFHAGENGKYFNLRLAPGGKILCAWMYVAPATPLHPLPRFFTYRPESNRRKRFVRGTIFSSLGKIYTIGKAKYGNGFRATILESSSRTSGRHDLIGVRVGLQESPDRPFSYPIYCYQLQRHRKRSEIKDAVGIHNIEDFKVLQPVANIDKIVSILIAAETSVSGVSFPERK